MTAKAGITKPVPGSPVPAKHSASVVIVRDGARALEVLLVRRNQKIVFHGGDWVFPGGRVDAEDALGDADDELAVARRTASRESFEEAGLHLAAESMLPFAHWTTPAALPKRFATWFFVATLEGEGEVRIDRHEIVDHRWLSPERALTLHAAGELNLPAPTYVTLLGFKDIDSRAAMMAHLRNIEIQHFTPRLVKFDGGRCTIYDEDAAYETLDLDTPGARHRLVMRGTQYEYVRDF